MPLQFDNKLSVGHVGSVVLMLGGGSAVYTRIVAQQEAISTRQAQSAAETASATAKSAVDSASSAATAAGWASGVSPLRPPPRDGSETLPYQPAGTPAVLEALRRAFNT